MESVDGLGVRREKAKDARRTNLKVSQRVTATRGNDVNVPTKFLIGEFELLAWNASVQRANVYAKSERRSEKQLARFREAVINRVSEFAAEYVQPVEEEHHCGNIVRLCEYASHTGGELLSANTYGCGAAQK